MMGEELIFNPARRPCKTKAAVPDPSNPLLNITVVVPVTWDRMEASCGGHSNVLSFEAMLGKGSQRKRLYSASPSRG